MIVSDETAMRAYEEALEAGAAPEQIHRLCSLWIGSRNLTMGTRPHYRDCGCGECRGTLFMAIRPEWPRSMLGMDFINGKGRSHP